MRFGLMNMFPDATIGAGGSTPQYTLQNAEKPVGDQKAKDGKNVNGDVVNNNTTQSVSIFSNYDKNTDGNVNYKESSSLFTRMDLSSYADNYQITNEKLSQDGNALSNIKKIANNNFNAESKFNSIAKNFMAAIGSTKIEISGQDQSAVQQLKNSTAKALDDKLKGEVSKAQVDYNAQLMDAYNQALVKAENEYAKDNQSANELGDGNSLEGKQAEEKEFGDVKTSKTTTDVFSQYDKNKDHRVVYSEVKGDIISYNNKVSIKPFSDANMNDVINNAFGGSVSDYAQNQFDKIALQGTNINVKTVSIETDGKDDAAKIQSKIAGQIDKLDKQVKSEATRLESQFNTQVYNQVSSEVNKAVAEYTLNDGKVTTEHKRDDLSKLGPKQPQPKGNDFANIPSGRAGNAPTNPTYDFSNGANIWNNILQPGGAADNLLNTLLSTIPGSPAVEASGGAEGKAAVPEQNISDCKNVNEVVDFILQKDDMKGAIPDDKLNDFKKDLVANNPRIFKKNGQVYNGADLTKLKLPSDIKTKYKT